MGRRCRGEGRRCRGAIKRDKPHNRFYFTGRARWSSVVATGYAWLLVAAVFSFVPSANIYLHVTMLLSATLSNAQKAKVWKYQIPRPNPDATSSCFFHRRGFFLLSISSFPVAFPDADALTIDNAALTHDLWRTRTPSIAVFLLTLSIHHAPRLLLVVVVVVVVVVARSSSSRNWQSACVCHDAPNI